MGQRRAQLWKGHGSGEGRAAAQVLLGAVLILIVLWLAIAAILTRARQGAIEAEQRVLERMVSVVEEQTRNFFSSVDFFLASTSSALGAGQSADPRAHPEFVGLVRILEAQSAGRIGAHVVTTAGDVHDLSGVNRDSIGNISARNYFAAPRLTSAGGLVIGDPEESSVTGRFVLPIYRALPPDASPPAYQVISSIDTGVLNTLYDHGRTKPHGSIALVRRDGVILARGPNGENVTGKSIASGGIWKEHLPRSARGIAVLSNALVDSTPRLTAYAALEDFPLVVLASSSLDDVLADWQRWAWGLLATGAALTVLLALGTHRTLLLLGRLADSRAETERQARRDLLTGLTNRRAFQEQLEQQITCSAQARRAFAVLFLDLDLFKEINDTYGHHVGDLLLKQAASRVAGCVRQIDGISRLGGDEFTVIVRETDAITVIDRIAQDILQALAAPFVLGAETAYVSASIGVARYPQDGDTAEDLIKHADQAMYAAKKAGRNRWTYFSPSMHLHAQERVRLLTELRAALPGRQLGLVYQPIVDLRSGEVRKAEALLRWHHPRRGLVPPGEFIPVLEDAGLIAEVGDWVFEQAARQAAAWRQSLHPDFQISINKSPRQFRQGGRSAADWIRHLEALGLPGASLAIEITEGLLLEAGEDVTGRLRELAGAGMQISLDDFGTGYSSLSYLKKFEIDFIKIDRSFVTDLETKAESVVLCEAIIVMAHKLGMKVIAEGIETPGQLRCLAQMGCDYGQGYYFSQPLGAQEFAERAAGDVSPRTTQAAHVPRAVKETL